MRRLIVSTFEVSRSWPLVLAAILASSVLVDPRDTSAQSASAPVFEVASIKPQQWTGQGSVGIFVRGNTLDAEHVSLFSLVEFAYNLREVQLSGGPFWVKSGVLSSSELYQVMAKVSGNPTPSMDVFRQMLQTLLADRFKLQVHHVKKELPIYNLVVNKGGPKLKESSEDVKFNFVSSGLGRLGVRIVATHMTVQQLIDHQLSGYTDRPILDKTGLTAPYDFTLEFAVENVPPAQETDSKDVPALVTAVKEQLGLKLEPGTAQFDTVVIDHADRPSEN
jgi:bla regulator protein blaR1